MAIILAGGRGERLNQSVPKQFLSLSGKPMLLYSLEQFRAIEGCKIILVISESDMAVWEEIKQQYNLTDIQIIKGGNSRFQSVKNALEKSDCENETLVAIHDAARPFINHQLISDGFKLASEKHTAVPFVNMNDSVRLGQRPIDRKLVKVIQTPQVYRFDILKKAYSVGYDTRFTDDSSVVESSGVIIHYFEGDPHNFKITTPQDLKMAEALVRYNETIL